MSGNDFVSVLLAGALLSLFINSVSPLGDSITLELAKREKFKFSAVRTIGSVGFAFAGAAAGRIYAINIAYIFLITFILRLSAGAVSVFIPRIEGFKKKAEERDSFFDLFKDKKLNIYYLYIFILGGMAYAARWFLYFSCLTPLTILFISAVHRLTVIPLYLCLAEYVSVNVEKNLKTRGQIMNYFVLSGPSAIIGSSLGGFISKITGLKLMFLVCAVICITAVCGFLIILRICPVFKNSGK